MKPSRAQIPAWHPLDDKDIEGGLECAFCPAIFSTFKELGDHTRETHKHLVEKEDVNMGKTIGDVKRERGVGGPPLLHGSDVPESATSVKVKVKDLREAPQNFKSAAILDFESPIFETEAWAVNITNLMSLAAKLGFDPPEEADFDAVAKKARGQTLTLQVVMVNNPSTGKLVRSLAIV